MFVQSSLNRLRKPPLFLSRSTRQLAVSTSAGTPGDRSAAVEHPRGFTVSDWSDFAQFVRPVASVIRRLSIHARGDGLTARESRVIRAARKRSRHLRRHALSSGADIAAMGSTHISDSDTGSDGDDEEAALKGSYSSNDSDGKPAAGYAHATLHIDASVEEFDIKAGSDDDSDDGDAHRGHSGRAVEMVSLSSARPAHGPLHVRAGSDGVTATDEPQDDLFAHKQDDV